VWLGFHLPFELDYARGPVEGQRTRVVGPRPHGTSNAEPLPCGGPLDFGLFAIFTLADRDRCRLYGCVAPVSWSSDLGQRDGPGAPHSADCRRAECQGGPRPQVKHATFIRADVGPVLPGCLNRWMATAPRK
jgi:hypothetical protein